MKKLVVLFTILISLLAGNAFSETIRYGCTGLTGGATGALDALDIVASGSPNTANLADGDSAGVFVISGSSAYFYEYVFDADGTDAENSPIVIRPDDYTTGGVWRLAKINSNALPDTGSSTFLGLSDTPAVADYTGHAGDYIRVNSTPDGLEFVAPSATPWMEPITKDSPTASTYRWFKADATLTVTGFDVIEAAADTGTITVDVYECSSAGTGCASILSAPVTATATGAAATITDTSIASGAWVEIVYGTPSGTISQVAATLKGTR